jgi:hypothetical protein
MPAKAGIQYGFSACRVFQLDASLRWHDGENAVGQFLRTLLRWGDG